jgi:hypothetical protein
MRKGSIINISIDKYKDIIDSDYKNSNKVDNELGIIYLPERKEQTAFVFKIVDINRFLLAKIKYNI